MSIDWIVKYLKSETKYDTTVDDKILSEINFSIFFFPIERYPSDFNGDILRVIQK